MRGQTVHQTTFIIKNGITENVVAVIRLVALGFFYVVYPFTFGRKYKDVFVFGVYIRQIDLKNTARSFLQE